MTAVTYQKQEHRDAIVDLLQERLRQDPDNVEGLIRALAIMACRKMTLQELEQWHDHLRELMAEES